MTLPSSPLALLSLASAGVSAIILVAYLVVRPQLVRVTKLWLFAGLGALPICAATTGNYQGFEATKDRAFCGGCHLMSLHTGDSDDPASQTLSARHARNKLFGNDNCYTCHADYGMFGTVVTKAGGMRHVWMNLTEYRDVSLEDARHSIKLLAPFPNSNCMQCHSTETALFLKRPDHAASLEDIRAGRVSCASAGCHGAAHPYFGGDGGVQ